MLKIIGAGFGRTGTASTQLALNALGFPCYHMKEVMKRSNRRHLAFWSRVAEAPQGAQHDWEWVFADYTAAVDFPASCVWHQLFEAYPDAKVLLTLHPGGAESWHKSTWDTIYYAERFWHWKVLEQVAPPLRRFASMARGLIWQGCLRGTMTDRDRAVARYQEWTEEVRATVPEERLLVFTVSEGWEPLCAFLGVPVPERAFPRVNERKVLRRAILIMKTLAILVLAAGAAAVIGLAVLVARALG